MATIPPINYGALKVTFPANLPKNEKELICMLLAGRLKDLFRGKLVCVQLAVDDLIKQTTGVSALAEMRNALVNLKTGIDQLKNATGYNAILNGVNKALGQINNVFSLGGLCPSPVHAPQIPDILGQMNANLFGQANNILNSLAKVMNPSMCLGGGPGGFGINWNSLTGDLKQLNQLLKAFDPDNPSNAILAALNAFQRNLKMQTARMNAEIRRLQQNLADPLGINNKQSTIKALQRAKNSSDGYPVKDANGILHTNSIRRMVTADVEAALDGDKTVVVYKTVPILNYCGDVEGYKRVAVSGDLNYAGWDPNNPQLNTVTPTVNPKATHLNYDFLFKEENNVIVTYNKAGEIVTGIDLSRGIAYKIGFELVDKEVKFYSNYECTASWTDGMTYSRSPAYGSDLEVITPDDTVSFREGELDWSVTIERPTTPNELYWRSTDGIHFGVVRVNPDSPTSIPLADRTYDLSMAMWKSWLRYGEDTTAPGVNGSYLPYETSYTAQVNLYDYSYAQVASVTLNDIPLAVGNNTTYVDTSGQTDPDKKILRTVVHVGDRYLICKRHVKEGAGLDLEEIHLYTSTSNSEDDATECVLMKFVDPLSISNCTKLPYSDNYSYNLTFLNKVNGEFIPYITPISNSDEATFELIEKGNESYIRLNVTSNREDSKFSIPNNEIILRSDIWIDKTKSRNFDDSFPKEQEVYLFVKTNLGCIELKMTLNG